MGTTGGAANDRPGPYVFVLFGATGDLAKRKLFPGLYKLAAAGRMPEEYVIVGSGRHSPGSDDEFRARIRDGLTDFVARRRPDACWKTC